MTRRAVETEAGQDIAELRRVVTREDIKAYADAGGDQNPLHQDDAFARSAGFEGIIAHGMFTMGHMAAAVVAWAGDAEAVTRISAQFRAPVFLGDELVAGGRVRSVDVSARLATLETWVRVTRDGVDSWPLKRGEATVRLD
jgi:acyl dehydratase